MKKHLSGSIKKYSKVLEADITPDKLEKYKTSLREYLKSTPQEFFAGVFSYLYAPDPKLREQIKAEAPETCKIILDAVEKGILPPGLS